MKRLVSKNHMSREFCFGYYFYSIKRSAGMATNNFSCDVGDGSYDSSGGEFPEGYCILNASTGTIVSTHCAPGFSCSGAPPAEIKARFAGDCVKIACSDD